MSKTVQGCPFLMGGYALGVEQFEIDPQTLEVSSVWGNPNVSCTSSIPVMSEDDETFYCIGKRDEGKNFSLEALDWKTGESKFFVDLGTKANPMYAGCEIGI